MNWDTVQGNWKQLTGRAKEEAEKQLSAWEKSER